jgi:hypothetical protein
MKLVDNISIDELQKSAKEMYGDFVKAVIDIKTNKLALGSEMHVDCEQLLLEAGSAQDDLWGINLYPSKFGRDDFIEFDSMINIRPHVNNMSRGVEDALLRKQIEEIVLKKISE